MEIVKKWNFQIRIQEGVKAMWKFIGFQQQDRQNSENKIWKLIVFVNCQLLVLNALFGR